MFDASVITALAAGAVYGLFFRSIPLIAYAMAAPRVRAGGKLAASSLVFALGGICWLLLPDRLPALGDCMAGWLYLLVAACAVHAFAPTLERRGATAAGLFVASATLFLLVPALLLRNTATLVLLATGFELTFKAYSFWTDASRAAARPRLRDCLTFLLVNPLLVYPARGLDLGVPSRSPRALTRVSVGVVGQLTAPFATAAISAVSPLALAWASQRAQWVATAAGAAVLLLHLAVQYLGHSSLASCQIGAMRLLGYQIPERYHYPFLARSPDEFWRRWNTYLGSWLQRYAYLPLARRYQRRLPQRWWLVGKAAALIAVFALCGAAHEAAGYALRFSMPVGVLIAFVFYALVLGLWIAGRLLALRLLGRARAASGAWRALAAAVTLPLSLAALLVFGSIALPALAGLGLHDDVARWVRP